MRRSFVKIWAGCAGAHLLMVGVCIAVALPIMDVSREPPDSALWARFAARALLFPTLRFMPDEGQLIFIVANSVVWGLAAACVWLMGVTVGTQIRNLTRR